MYKVLSSEDKATIKQNHIRKFEAALYEQDLMRVAAFADELEPNTTVEEIDRTCARLRARIDAIEKFDG